MYGNFLNVLFREFPRRLVHMMVGLVSYFITLANTKWAEGFLVCASGCQELLSRRSGEELREQEGLLQVQWYPHIHGRKKPNM